MRHKKQILMVIMSLAMLFVLVACGSGKHSIQGKWNAQDGAGKNQVLTFSKDKMTIDGTQYEYKQTGLGFKNNISYLIIEQNGESYSVIFPEKGDDVAMIIQPDSDKDNLTGKLLYAMSKTSKPSYDEYAKKYLND